MWKDGFSWELKLTSLLILAENAEVLNPEVGVQK